MLALHLVNLGMCVYMWVFYKFQCYNTCPVAQVVRVSPCSSLRKFKDNSDLGIHMSASLPGRLQYVCQSIIRIDVRSLKFS